MEKTNKAGGRAFQFENPAEYLLATVGSAMFVEPKFYTDTESLEQLKSRVFNTEGLDEQALKIIDACFQVAEGKNPRDLLAIAHWARTELNMRTTPQVMLAIAANHPRTKEFVRKYVAKIAQRGDEVKQVVGAYEHIFGWGSFPACLKKGVSDKLSTLTEYEILKYNTKAHPTYADLLCFCDRRKNYPFSKAMSHYLLTGEVINSSAIPVIAARQELNSLKEWSDEVPALARRAGATWENLVSKFGSSPEVWEFASTQMGYMALLRNLANFLTQDLSMRSIQRIADRIADPEKVAASKQLPFRFLAAHRTLQPKKERFGIYALKQQRNAVERDRSVWNADKTQVLLNAVEAALDCSIQSVPEVPGKTLIAADNSGSMSDMLSGKSVMTIRDAANTLCAILYKSGGARNVDVLSFGENVVPVSLNQSMSVMQIVSEIEDQHNTKDGGHSTNAWKVLNNIVRSGKEYDRIVFLSDMQCYDMMSGVRFHRGSRSVADELKKYRANINEHCFAHFFDLAGYGTRQTEPGDSRDNVVAGFSEKILDQILVFENGNVSEEGELVSGGLPTLDYVRENY